MKKLLLTLSFLFLPLLTQAASVSDYSPVSHWDLDEGSGVRYDSAGLANDLSDINTVASTTGLLLGAADFEKSNSESLTISDGVQSGLDFLSAFSVSMWVKHESFSSFYYVNKDGASPQHSIQIIGFQSGGDKVRYALSNNGTNIVNSDVAFSSSISLGTWYHLVFVYTGTVVRVYRDGVLQGSTATTISSLKDSSATFSLGIPTTQSFDGFMDEVSVFDYELTQADVTVLYNSGTPLPYGGVDSSSFIPLAVVYDGDMVTEMNCTYTSTSSQCVPEYTVDYGFVFSGFAIFLLTMFALMFYFKRNTQI